MWSCSFLEGLCQPIRHLLMVFPTKRIRANVVKMEVKPLSFRMYFTDTFASKFFSVLKVRRVACGGLRGADVLVGFLTLLSCVEFWILV